MQTDIKHRLFRLCQDYVLTRIESAELAIQNLQASANEETKSSAGDKYETGRAMMQLEIEKHAMQLAALSKQKQTLDKINPEIEFKTVQLGALVITDRANYFLAISAGQFVVDNKKYVCISLSSPIGAKLLGLKAGDSFSFNQQNQLIAEVC
jgi:transcription elongation GreA/GreB family factor